MQHLLPMLLVAFLVAIPATAQDTRYISDDIFVPLRKGPGNDYGWRAKLTPGKRLTVTKDQGDWSEVTTDRGTSGWVRSEYLTSATPAQLKLPQAEQRAQTLGARNAELDQQLKALRETNSTLQDEQAGTAEELAVVSKELAQLKQISGKALQLDEDNRRLVEEAENLRSEVDMLEAENQRLNDKLDTEDFINGALAVVLGVIITLVVPRLWPKRRRSSSWA